ncbi:putative ribonuclease H protein [Glycine soja]
MVVQNSQQGMELSNSIEWRLGCGDRIKFWEDKWVDGEESLAAKYPRLYLISCQQNQIIQQMGGYREEEWEWNFLWRRPLFDNEIPMAVNFLQHVESKAIQIQRRDDWVWTPDSSGQYTAKSAYRMMMGGATDGTQDRDFEELWKMKVPTKFAVFAWRLLRDRLPTKTNLRRRQVEIDDRICPFCRSAEEEAGHLFFHCTKIIPMWWESLSWVNNVGVFPQDPRQHFLQHGSIVADGLRTNRWKCWWLAVTWTIWKKRNDIIFSNDSFDINKMMEEAAFLMWTWLRNLEKDFVIHFNQWSSNLREGFVYH